MAFVETIGHKQASGVLSRIYDAAVKRTGKVFNILRVQSLNPPILQSSLALYQSIMFGDSPLTRAQREMLAVVVSRTNDCHY